MFTRSSFELKVGIFIFIGIVILAVIIFSIGNFYSIRRGYTFNVIFSFANGIEVGAPVRYAGVEVGEVKDIQVYYDMEQQRPMVRLLVWVAQDAWITEDSRATINTLGLLGEKYLEIIPGHKESRRIQKGDILRGHDPVSTEELTRETRIVLKKVNRVIESLDKIVGDEENRKAIKNTIANLESLSVDLREFVSMAREGEGTLGRFMSDDKLYRDIDEFILDLKKHPWKLLYRPKQKR